MGMEDQIKALEERNKRVEADKAWEKSLTRRLTVLIITFVAASILFWWMGSRDFYLQALVPTSAYLLSTLSLPWIKKQWMKNYSKK